MHTTRAIGATATLLAVLAASGCGGSSGGSSSTSAPSATHTSKSGIASGEPTPATTSKSSTASASSSAKPTPSSKGTAAGAPGVPEAARQHTEAGATAFVAHYLDVMNTVAQKPDSKPLIALSETGCKTCREWINAIDDQVADKTYYDHPIFKKPKNVRTVKLSNEKYHLFIDLHQGRSTLRHRESDRVVTVSKAQHTKLVFELNWTSGGWRMDEVQKDA